MEVCSVVITAVRITMFKSAEPFKPKKPITPEYTPLASCSNRSIISIVLILGAPVIEPPGKALRMQSIAVIPSRKCPRIVVTSWCTVA